MSGVYFIVEELGTSPDRSRLTPTKGGYPHATLFYSGKKIMSNDLMETSVKAFAHLYNQGGVLSSFELSNLKLNTFTLDDGRIRTDILLPLPDAMNAYIETIRKALILPDGVKRDDLSMHPTHVTHSIHFSEESARNAAELLKASLPMSVKVTGVTID